MEESSQLYKFVRLFKIGDIFLSKSLFQHYIYTCDLCVLNSIQDYIKLSLLSVIGHHHMEKFMSPPQNNPLNSLLNEHFLKNRFCFEVNVKVDKN